MKRIPFLISAVFFTMSVAYGQALPTQTSRASSAGSLPRPHKRLHLNPILGVTAFSFAGANSDNTNPSVGVVAGSLIAFGSRDLTFETGGWFSQEGGEQGQGLKRVAYTYNYLGVPLFAKYILGGDDGEEFHIRGGVIPQYMIAASSRATTAQGLVSRDLGEQTNRVDALAAIGLGGDVGVGRSKLTLDALYSRGLTRVNKEGPAIYNQGFMVAGGVRF